VPTPKLFGVEIPFVHHLGFEMVFMEGGHSELRYLPRHEHMNSFLVAHGGAVMTWRWRLRPAAWTWRSASSPSR
jgi:hypothetical protein